MNPRLKEDNIKVQQIEADVQEMLKMQEFYPLASKRQIETQLKESFRAFQAIIEQQPLQQTEYPREVNLLIAGKSYQSLLNIPQQDEQGRMMKYEERQAEINPLFQSQQWEEVQRQLVGQYKIRCIEQFTSHDQGENLAKDFDFIKQNGIKSTDCKQILSKVSKNILISQLFFNQMKLQAEKMGISAELYKQHKKELTFLEQSYQNELTKLQGLFPDKLHSFLTTFVDIKLFPASSYILQRQKKSPQLHLLAKKESKVQQDLSYFQEKHQKESGFDSKIKVQEEQLHSKNNCKQEA